MSLYVEGILKKNDEGRFEFSSVELYIGSACEIFFADKWIKGRLQYDEHLNDYFFSMGKDRSGYGFGLRAGMRARMFFG